MAKFTALCKTAFASAIVSWPADDFLRLNVHLYRLHNNIIFLFLAQEILQQPLMHFLVQEASRRGITTQSIQGINLLIDPYEKSRNLLSTVCYQVQSTDKDRLLSFLIFLPMLVLCMPQNCSQLLLFVAALYGLRNGARM